MNYKDKQNLAFLLTASPATIRAWYDTCTQMEKMYAIYLLAQAELEMNRSEDQEPIQYDQNIDCTAAKQLLSQFTLKGKT